MSGRTRLLLALPALAAFGALFAWSLVGIHPFGDFHGRYGSLLNHVAVPQRHISNVVAATVFDYRSFDTLGEELILMTATIGITMLLRSSGEEGGEQKRFRDRVRFDGISVPGVLALGAILLVGLWLAAFGYVTPGGGFQGGVVVAGAVLLLYLVGGRRDYAPFRNEELLDPLEAVGAGGYVVIGLAALVSGLPFLENLLPFGKAGTLLSGGSIPFLNWASGLEVAAAVLVLFAEFLETYIAPLGRDAET